MIPVAEMIDVEIWESGAGSRAMWRGKLPAVPREGERLHLHRRSGKVDRVTWHILPRGAIKAVILLDDMTRTVPA